MRAQRAAQGADRGGPDPRTQPAAGHRGRARLRLCRAGRRWPPRRRQRRDDVFGGGVNRLVGPRIQAWEHVPLGPFLGNLGDLDLHRRCRWPPTAAVGPTCPDRTRARSPTSTPTARADSTSRSRSSSTVVAGDAAYKFPPSTGTVANVADLTVNRASLANCDLFAGARRSRARSARAARVAARAELGRPGAARGRPHLLGWRQARWRLGARHRRGPDHPRRGPRADRAREGVMHGARR